MKASPAVMHSDWEISFSTMLQGLACPRSVAFDKTTELRSLLTSPSLAGVMGSCAHVLLSRFAPHSLPERDFESAWKDEVDRAALRLEGPGLGSVPAPESWPGYWLTYTRTKSRLVGSDPPRLPPAAEHRERSADLQRGGGLPLVEKRLRDLERHITGTPDLVYRDAEGALCILDYKTGTRVSPERESAQLHLYAHLVQLETGERPQFGEIDRLRGQTERQRLADSRIKNEVTRAMEVRRVVLEPEPEGAASAEACRKCPYRLVCSRSLVATDEPQAGDLVGRVQDVFHHSSGHPAAVSITTDHNSVVLGGLESRQMNILPGMALLVMGARGAVGGHGLLADWSTVVVTDYQINVSTSPD